MMQPNVLFLMVDAMRADQASGPGRYCRTPVLDSLGKRATRFTNAFSTASMTTCCTASIMTGSYPFMHGIRSLADHRLRPDMPTLAEAFKSAGYVTWAEVTGPLMPATGLARGFDHYQHRDYRETLDTPWGSEFLAGLKRHREPWFGFVHLWELHNPRRVTPSYNQPEYGRNLYERAVSSLDYQLGHLLDALPDNTVLILTGDHGEYVSPTGGGDTVGRLKRPFKWLKRYIPGVKKLRKLSPLVFETMDRLGQRDNDIYFNWIGHGYHVYDYLVHVPLFLYGPGLFPAGVEIPQLASHVDLFPTLASALNLEVAQPVLLSGTDLMPIIQASGGQQNGRAVDDDRAVYLEASGGRTTPSPDQWLTGLRTRRYKYVRGLFNPSLPEELYDLSGDPAEQDNVAAQQPEVTADLRYQLQELLQSDPHSAETTETTYSEDEFILVQEQLRRLGYLK